MTTTTQTILADLETAVATMRADEKGLTPEEERTVRLNVDYGARAGYPFPGGVLAHAEGVRRSMRYTGPVTNEDGVYVGEMVDGQMVAAVNPLRVEG